MGYEVFGPVVLAVCVSGWVRGSPPGTGRGLLWVVGVVSGVVVSVVLAVGVGAQGAGDCYVGLVVRPGGSCTYPGTDVEFVVDDSGSGRLLFFSSGQRLELRATSINGVEYTFVASRQSGGGWLIEEVGGGSAATTGPMTTPTTGPTTTPTTAPPAPGVDATGGFSDVEGSTHEEAIRGLAADGVFVGTECAPNAFCPTDPVQRRVMAVWLVRLLDGEDPATVVFVAVRGCGRFAVVGAVCGTPGRSGSDGRLRDQPGEVVSHQGGYPCTDGDVPRPRVRAVPSTVGRVRRRYRWRTRRQHRRSGRFRRHQRLQNTTPPLLPHTQHHPSTNGNLPHPRPEHGGGARSGSKPLGTDVSSQWYRWTPNRVSSSRLGSALNGVLAAGCPLRGLR